MEKFERGCKINFVDENNVFVGYDLSQCCCEDADWIVTDKEPSMFSDVDDGGLRGEDIPWQALRFDTRYFKVLPDPDGRLDSGGAVTFRMIADGLEFFLTLYNCQNGYYGHGFEASIGGQKWQEGGL